MWRFNVLVRMRWVLNSSAMKFVRLSVFGFIGVLGASSLTAQVKKEPVVEKFDLETVDGISKAVIGHLKTLPVIVATVKDEASGQVALERIGKLSEDLLVLSARLSKLDEPTEAEKVVISKRFEAQLENTNAEFRKALEELKNDPELVRTITLAMQDFGSKLAKGSEVFEKYFEPTKTDSGQP